MQGKLSSGWWPARAVALAAVLVLAAAPAGAAAPDYAPLEEALLQNVRDGYVDYDGLAASPQFARFIDGLATTAIPADHDAALAHYLNAYNALAIRGILQGESPASAAGRRRFFDSRKFTLDGRAVTLGEIGQRLRALGDLRAWFAMSCAALSCPRLASHAYQPATLDAQLDAAVRGFVNDITRNRLDIAQKTAFLSALFDWHRADFTAAAGGVSAWLERYLADPASRAALREGWLELRYLDFDWDLNGRYARGTADPAPGTCGAATPC
ncbi:MAG: DUF547 domain-containing protein [Gammaproteobacteria bacterium]